MRDGSSSMASPMFFAIIVLRILSPFFVFLVTTSLIFTRPSPPTYTPSPVVSVVVASRIPRRAAILSLLSLVALTYLLDGLARVFFVVFHKKPMHNTVELSTVIGLAAFSGLAALGSWKDIHGVKVWFLRRVRVAIAFALILDVGLFVLLGLSVRRRYGSSPVPLSSFLGLAFPALRALLLIPLLASLFAPRVVYQPVESGDDQYDSAQNSSSLLLPPDAVANPSSGLLAVPSHVDSSKYGTFRPGRSILQQSAPTTRAPTPAPSAHTKEQSDVTLDPSWSELWGRVKRLTPYLWPSKSPSLQFLAMICVLLLLLGRVVNAAMPFTLGELVDIFEHPSDKSPWPVLGAYVFFRFLQGSGGLAALRDMFWAPVMQYSDREMSQMSFNHLLNLSFSFHTRRKTGEILRVLDRGAAINNTFELILFNIVPTFIDIAVALVVFCVKFDWTLALIIFFVMFAYVAASIILTKWRTKIRRQMNERDIITRGIHTDCLLNYETVKYFGGEEHEAERYRQAIGDYQALEYRVIMSLNLLNMVQNFIITLGLLLGSIIVARRVVKDQSGARDFIIFITYLAQLYTPLNQLGSIYRSVNQSLIDTEKLLKLLSEPTDVNDKPDAPNLDVQNGEIEFEDVNFSYDGRSTALNGVSFKVPKNSSVALVGESGSGKSTILRLLYRFYDLGPGQGRILIDGQDIRDVTQKSLRQAIGVVPQDPVLFNTSIRYNIGYGKFGASDEEIEAAARSAQMHERIMSFPDAYETTVGERGVRLSGGEKQRVAISRVCLKNPPILLLDEATSALDTNTEREVQAAFQLLKMGRSSLSIAHRLSTIANADLILVLKNGQIVEQGSHKELLALDGIFAAMWADQMSASDTGSIDVSQKPEVAGYSVEDDAPPAVASPDVLEAQPDAVSEPVLDSAQPEDPAENVQPPEEDEEEAIPAQTAPEEPVAFPSTDESISPSPPSPAPVAFPGSGDETPSETQQPPAAGPGVTFETASSPSRTETPDPDAEPKRKRISSQNFQRLARRISITTRRQGSISSMIPGLKKSESSPRASIDDSAGGNDSPTSSTAEGKTKKKDKKDKKRKSQP